MPWSELDYQKRVVVILKRAVAGGHVAHAYLFHGQTGAGKHHAARLLAQALNCENGNGEACGACQSCSLLSRSMDPESSLHPDIVHLAPGRWIHPDGKKQSSYTILIDAVRQLRASLYTPPLQAKWRVVIVHDVDTMQIPAQNAFLKTLEEPLAQLRTIFVLLSTRPLSLLPTIRSRCQSLFFAPVAHEAIKQRLQDACGLPVDLADEMARLADGDLDRAMEMAQQGEEEQDRKALRDQRLGIWHEAAFAPLKEIDNFEEIGRSREEYQEVLNLLIAWHRDLLLVSGGGDQSKLTHSGHLDWLKAEAERFSMKQVIKRMERLIQIREELEQYYVRGDLALKSLLLDMAVEA